MRDIRPPAVAERIFLEWLSVCPIDRISFNLLSKKASVSLKLGLVSCSINSSVRM